MKTKIKRHSRAVISVILAIIMLVSCMMVGLIATDAARVNDEAVGNRSSWSNGTVIYIDLSSCSYEDGGAYIKVQGIYNNSDSNYDNGSGGDGYATTSLGNHIYKITTTNDWAGIKVFRCGNWDNNWQSKDYTNAMFKDDQGTHRYVKVTGWGTAIWSDGPGYFLHYAVGDSDMSSATVEMMTDNTTNFTYTVPNWSNTKINFNVNRFPEPVNDKSTNINTVTMTEHTGISSVDETSPKENSGYMRSQVTLTSQPQNVTFTYTPPASGDKGTLNVSGSIVAITVTAGGSTSDYRLEVSDGVTTISNRGATNSAMFYQGTTLTVKVYPTDNTKKG